MFLKKLILFFSEGTILLSIKTLSSLLIGTAFAIMVHVVTGSSTLVFVFVLLSVTLAFLRFIWSYRLMGVLLTNLFFIALFFIFKLYVGLAILE